MPLVLWHRQKKKTISIQRSSAVLQICVAQKWAARTILADIQEDDLLWRVSLFSRTQWTNVNIASIFLPSGFSTPHLKKIKEDIGRHKTSAAQFSKGFPPPDWAPNVLSVRRWSSLRPCRSQAMSGWRLWSHAVEIDSRHCYYNWEDATGFQSGLPSKRNDYQLSRCVHMLQFLIIYI